MDRIAEHRSFYANLITARAERRDERLIAAFSKVERERFCGPGPWQVAAAPQHYVRTPSADPTYCYQDILIGLDPERGINNGEPSLHAGCLAALRIERGETVVHIGAGTGYYTAIMAELTGPGGTVLAYEIEPALARLAAANLRDYPKLRVLARSGSAGGIPPADVIYVNAGATHPLGSWLDALRPGGRLLFPLTPEKGLGAMLLVGRGHDGMSARFIMPAQFYPCAGARDEALAAALEAAFARGDQAEVRSLRRAGPPDETCWIAGPGWWLSKAPPAG